MRQLVTMAEMRDLSVRLQWTDLRFLLARIALLDGDAAAYQRLAARTMRRTIYIVKACDADDSLGYPLKLGTRRARRGRVPINGSLLIQKKYLGKQVWPPCAEPGREVEAEAADLRDFQNVAAGRNVLPAATVHADRTDSNIRVTKVLHSRAVPSVTARPRVQKL